MPLTDAGADHVAADDQDGDGDHALAVGGDAIACLDEDLHAHKKRLLESATGVRLDATARSQFKKDLSGGGSLKAATERMSKGDAPPEGGAEGAEGAEEEDLYD